MTLLNKHRIRKEIVKIAEELGDGYGPFTETERLSIEKTLYKVQRKYGELLEFKVRLINAVKIVLIFKIADLHPNLIQTTLRSDYDI